MGLQNKNLFILLTMLQHWRDTTAVERWLKDQELHDHMTAGSWFALCRERWPSATILQHYSYMGSILIWGKVAVATQKKGSNLGILNSSSPDPRHVAKRWVGRVPEDQASPVLLVQTGCIRGFLLYCHSHFALYETCIMVAVNNSWMPYKDIFLYQFNLYYMWLAYYFLHYSCICSILI